MAIARRMEQQPGASFPVAFRDDAELEAVYRFFSNQHFASSDLVEGHLSMSARRCAAVSGRVLAVHDSTELRFLGERDDLGYLKNGQGLLFHPCLAVDPTGRVPLGLLSFQMLRLPEPTGPLTHAERQRRNRATPRADKASIRWDRGVQAAEHRMGCSEKLVHVMDQEGDAFALLALLQDGLRYIVRGQLGRTVNGRDGVKVEELLEEAPLILEREVALSPRPSKKGGRTPNRNRCHPVREGRPAQLEVRAREVSRRRPKDAQTDTREVALNVVYVREVNVTDGEKPVEWLLYTSEPIRTADEVAWVVDGYRCRWVIEEYFKALKTGCAIEKRQLTSGERLEKVVALFSPLAWRLLLLRALARRAEPLPASEIFDAMTLDVLRALLEAVLRGKYPLSPKPSASEVYLAIAKLGGHIKNNGEPGWQTLGRGYEELLRAVALAQVLRHLKR